jgi:transketolase
LFEAQDAGYQESVLPKEIRARVAVEAGVPFGWERWVKDEGRIIALNRFGASAPGKVVYKELGFTVENVVHAARDVLRVKQAE